MLRDANFNVVGLLDDSGSVLQQFDHDPYGGVIGYEQFGAWAHNRIGFQGLFADRFDVDAPQPELRPGADITYNARNRDLRPDLGRWVQRDPNGTAGAAVQTAARLGSAFDNGALRADLAVAYADGGNLYAGMRHNPGMGADPLGLIFTLPDLTISTGLRKGMDVYGKYDAVNTFKTLAQSLMTGVGMQQALLAAGFEVVMSNPGGRVLGRLVDGAQVVGRHADEVADGVRHHLLPKFLGGSESWAREYLKRLPNAAHEDYHRMLREHFRKAGLPSPNDPMLGRKKWMDLLDKSPEKADAAVTALLDATAEFDGTYASRGVTLMPELLELLYKQGWPPRP